MDSSESEAYSSSEEEEDAMEMVDESHSEWDEEKDSYHRNEDVPYHQIVIILIGVWMVLSLGTQPKMNLAGLS